jgi:hypothetical protein
MLVPKSITFSLSVILLLPAPLLRRYPMQNSSAP